MCSIRFPSSRRLVSLSVTLAILVSPAFSSEIASPRFGFQFNLDMTIRPFTSPLMANRHSATLRPLPSLHLTK
ncbi:hypothetical protein L218DRAFT_964658 [Marasmius fiardii PR-910]|nr:hypothetical protein L218DRAFT_964658 [Marasmius fiardii PR-910]